MRELSPPAVVRPADGELKQLAQRINAEHEACEAAMRQSVAHALAAGRLLAEVKKRVGHGEWLPWLEANVSVSKRTAQLYLKLAKDWPTDESKAQRVALLPLREAVAALKDADDEQSAATAPESSVLQEWRQSWQKSGAEFPAATGAEYCRWLNAAHPGLLPDNSPPEDDSFWRDRLLEALLEPAARHLLRTGEELSPPPSLRFNRTLQDHVEETNDVLAWSLRVKYTLGGFLNWCQKVGIVLRGKRLPEPPDDPPIEAIKVTMWADLHPDSTLSVSALWSRIEQEQACDDLALAECFGIPPEKLPEAAVAWMWGKYYSFVLTAPELCRAMTYQV